MTALDNIQTNNEPRIRRFKKSIKKVCSKKVIERKLPLIQWLPKYSVGALIQDIIAGITVGLTAIPQGIANALIAGLSPEYGLNAGLLGGFVYVIFGSVKDITVGPTAIIAAMISQYVDYSPDFAVLATFLAGLVEFLMGAFNFGFLVEFISMPVISGFSTAAALQIAASQFKSLFGLQGSSGNYFAQSIVYFFENVKTARLWDPVLGFGTIFGIMLLKCIGQGCSNTGGILQKTRWYLSLSRNAVVVVIGIIIAFVIKQITDEEPLILVGAINRGLPIPGLPPFSTTVGNDTYSFTDMLGVFGPKSFIIPLVSTLEAVAIAKAFSNGLQVDSNQEMIALGLCNIASSCVNSMPITGSFTKTALNNASGVRTTAGGIFNCLLVILSLTTLTTTFYYIPKASLAGLVISAMFAMVDYKIFGKLWRHSKRELCVLVTTLGVCLGVGLEYGIVTGVLFDALIVLYGKARPTVDFYVLKIATADLIIVPLNYTMSYCASEQIRKTILRAARTVATDSYIVIDGTNLENIDLTVASNLMSVAGDVEKRTCPVLFLNFDESIKYLCVDIKPQLRSKFVSTTNVSDTVDVYLKCA
ncbi:unnamed protein product [Pieris brassicae]|uniref:STAS domain-containing protein n=1 Tax=Pieris brassicae TaxID=7116 RepID=A0A9P0SL22_PIEBR|nr:unnamed protein product [Pieris brassicae]